MEHPGRAATAAASLEDLPLSADPRLQPCLLALLTSLSCPAAWFEVNECWTLRDLAYGWDDDDLPPHVVPVWVDANERMDKVSRARARARSWVNSASSQRMAESEKAPLINALVRAPDLIPRRLADELSVPRSSGILEVSGHAVVTAADRASEIKAAYAERLLVVLGDNMTHSTKSAAFEACGVDLRHEYSKLLKERLLSFSIEALRACNAALRRWCKWCTHTSPPLPAFPPVPVHVALFLQAVSEGSAVAMVVKRRKNAGGGGAAEGVRGGLRFAQLHLGFNFGLGEEEVATAGLAQAVAAQFQDNEAAALRPRDIVSLVRLSACGNWIIEYLALAVLQVLMGAIRYGHAERSTVLEVYPTHVTWRCSQGKSRVAMRQAPPFNWVAPVVQLRPSTKTPVGSDITSKFLQLRAAIHPGNPALVVPALSPPGASLDKATGFLQDPMPPSKFNKVLPQLIQYNVGMPPRSGQHPSSKSLRRTSQALCEAAGLELHERLAFGNWQDDFTDKQSRRQSSRQNMPHVYTDKAVKERTQLDAKAFVWTALAKVVGDLGEDIADAEWGEVMADKLKPACLLQREAHPRQTTTTEVAAAVAEAPEGSGSESERGEEKKAFKKASSSASSSSSETDPSSSLAEDPVDFMWLEWGLTAGPTARIHKLKGGNLPGCARFATLESDRQGLGVALATKLFPSHKWCTRCAPEVCEYVLH